MPPIFKTGLCILIEVCGIVINIVNAFLTNIIVYEASSGLSFNWELLFSNSMFWWVSVIQLLYGLVTLCVQIKTKNSDDRLKKAIEDREIALMDQVVNFSKKGKFDSANKVMDILDKFEERRNK